MYSSYLISCHWTSSTLKLTDYRTSVVRSIEKLRHVIYIDKSLRPFRTMIWSYCAAITVFCISLLLDSIHHNKRYHSNSSAGLNHNMPENDQPQVDSPLTAWVKIHLGSLHHDESTTGEEADFQTAFNSTFSEKVSIHLNHKPISRDNFESEMRNSRSALSRSSTIDWKQMVEIPTKSEEGATSGVGIPSVQEMRRLLVLTFGFG